MPANFESDALERRALDLFDEAMEGPIEDLEARVTATCQANPEVAELLRGLLRAETAARPALPTIAPVSAALAEPPPERIGPFRLTELIGAGGMGAVYRGERDDGLFDQQVAIKLMRPGLLSPRASAQFAQERQILARLTHPNISRLFDGGIDEAGRSYIVMELIHGEAITRYIEARRLPLKAAVALLAPVLDAVQHAHQANVTHADIKPGNVLVDTAGAPKLLDFGIAQTLEAAGDGPPLALTLAYASPARRAGERATPADDVYALGAVLWELIAGRAPPETLPLPRPGGAADGDLEAVVAKATAPATDARYPSVSALADDLTRWLELRPVRARSSDWRHALTKLAQRRPWASVATGAAALGLVAATTVTSLLYARAERERAAAEQRFDEVRTLARYMLFDVVDRLDGLSGAAELRRDVAEVGRTYLERLSAQPRGGDDLALEVAAGYSRVGRALGLNTVASTGDVQAGEAALAKAVQLLRGLHAARPERRDVTLELAKALTQRAQIKLSANNAGAEALAEVGEALKLYDTALAARPNDLPTAYDRWQATIVKGDVLGMANRQGEVIALLTDTERWAAALPPDAGTRRAMLTAAMSNSLADALYYSGRRGEALGRYRMAAAVLEEARAHGPDIRILDRLMLTQFNISSTLSDMDRPAESLAWADRGAASARDLLLFDQSPRSQRLGQIINLQRAVALSMLGRHDEAIAAALANAESRRAFAEQAPADYERQRAYAVALRPLAETYERAGRKADACKALIRAQALWRGLAAGKGLTGFDQDGEAKLVDELAGKCAA